MSRKVEIIRFKPSGKYYTTEEIEVRSETSWEIIDELRVKQQNALSPEMSWLITGKGMPNEVPHLLPGEQT